MKDDYQKARDILRASIKKYNFISDIWEFGSYKNPGLSDMDLMIIINDKANKLAVKKNLEKIINDKNISKAMAHANPIILPLSNCKDVFLWDDISVFSLRNNSKISDPLTDEVKLNYRNNAMVVDFVFERIYRINKYKKNIKNLKDFRKILGVCKSLRYSLIRLKRLIKLEKKTLSIFRKFSLALDNARSSYIKEKNLRKKNTQKVIKIAFEAGKQAEKEIRNKNLPIFRNIKEKNNLNCDFIFPDRMVYSFNNEFKKNSINSVNIPSSLIFQILSYSLAKGSLSRLLKSSFKFKCNLNFNDICLWHNALLKKNIQINNYHKFILARINAANKWFDFLVERKLEYGLFKFGWYLPNNKLDI